ncbi:MAG: MATE family efflux transporter [Calditrichaeota bacterium]|nr:MAG: MATE family efflux transporter [Calditrichota bacterium]
MENVQELKNDITDGPISKTILKLALPVTLGMIMEFALTTTDYFWVGKLGATAQDAVTTSMVVIWTIYVMISIITIGVTALVARYIGSKDFDKVGFFIRQGLSLAIIFGLSLSVLGYLVTPILLSIMDASEATLVYAIPYLRISFIAAIFFFWTDTIYAVFRASGDTKTPATVAIITIIINMILDPLLIFGYGPFPELGVSGAAIATTVSIIIAVIIITILMNKGKLGYKVEKLFNLRPSLKEMLRIIKIGLPITSQQFVFVIVYWFLIKVVHSFGEAAGAAMGIGNRMESLSYLTCFGFSTAASTMVGQNLGANKPDRAAKCAWGTTRIAIYVTLVMSAVFIILPKYIATIFTDDPAVLTIAIDYLIILGISQIAMAIEIVIEGAFSGAGDTMPPMIVMIPGSLARIPLAYYLAYNLEWGINGVWWTLTITTLIKSSILAIWFAKGNWKKKEV